MLTSRTTMSLYPVAPFSVDFESHRFLDDGSPNLRVAVTMIVRRGTVPAPVTTLEPDQIDALVQMGETFPDPCDMILTCGDYTIACGDSQVVIDTPDPEVGSVTMRRELLRTAVEWLATEGFLNGSPAWKRAPEM